MIIIDDEYKLDLDENQKILIYKNGIALHEKQPKKLYRYIPFTQTYVDSLKESFFYASNPKNFNDPFDCSRILVADDKFPNLKNDYSNIGVTSFSINKDNIIMWGHYTRNYNGIVVEYDVSEMFQNGFNNIVEDSMISFALCPVIYPKKPKRISSKEKLAYMYSLITKYKDWSYENEYRIIFHFLQESKYVSRQIFYNKSCVSKIMVGYNLFSSPDFDNLYRLFKNEFKDVEIQKVAPSEKGLELDFFKI